MKQTCVIYARKSQDDARSSDLRSTDWQVEQARTVAATHGWNVVDTLVDDGMSGGSAKRAGLIKLNRLIDSKSIGVIVVWELSRLWRDSAMLNEFLTRCDRLGVKVFEFSSGRFRTLSESTEFLGTMTQAAVDEFMRRQTSDRVRAKFRAKAAAGLPLTAAGFGYRNVRLKSNDGDWIVQEIEARVVKRIYRDYAAGQSVRQIVHALNNESAPTPQLKKRGRRVWTPTTVNKILRRAIYRGELPNGFQRDNLRIVDDGVWHRVQSGLDAARGGAPSAPTRRSSRWLLSSVLRCPECGSSMVAYGGFAYRCYSSAANGPAVCAGSIRLPLQRTDAAVAAAVVPHLKSELLERAVAQAVEKSRQSTQRGDKTASRAALVARIERIRNLATEGVLELADAKAKIVAAQAALDAIDAQQTVPTPAIALQQLRALAAQLPRLFVEQPIEARQVLRTMVSSARVEGDAVVLTLNIPSVLPPRC